MSAILEIMEQTLLLAQTNYQLSATQAKQQVASSQSAAASTIASGDADANMSLAEGSTAVLSAGANLASAGAAMRSGKQEADESSDLSKNLDQQQQKSDLLGTPKAAAAGSLTVTDLDPQDTLKDSINDKVDSGQLHQLSDQEVEYLNHPQNKTFKVKVQKSLNDSIQSTKDSLRIISNKYQSISSKWDKATGFVSSLGGASKYYTGGQQVEKASQEAKKLQTQTVSDMSRSTLSQLTQAAQDAVSRALALFQVLDKLSQSNKTSG